MWCWLVHVCRRWRSVVFASPIFLDLKLVCTPWRRVGLIHIWASLPIIIRDDISDPMPQDYEFEAAIVHSCRVCQISLRYITHSQLQRLASAMQKQFPALTRLKLNLDKHQEFICGPMFALPDGFLGGSVPRLQSLKLDAIPFPALPKLLLSATDLVCLSLENIPRSGYFSPEAIVTASPAWLCWPTLNLCPLDSNHIFPEGFPSRKADARRRQRAPFSPLSLVFTSKGLLSAWRTSCPDRCSFA